MKRIVAILIAASLVTIQVITSVSCAVSEGEGFGIYLTEGNLPPSQIETVNDVRPAAEPVICQGDIVSYNSQTYELRVSQEAYQRVTSLDVPVEGRSFVVCLDKNPVYAGAFWTPISSFSYSGIVIWKPVNADGTPILTLELGYPSTSTYDGEDRRNDPGLMKALEGQKKLIKRLSVETIVRLPESMKGYELYSWEAGGKWHFTLITGTNRNKTWEEITTEDDFISEASWVRIHVTGVDALEKALGKLRAGEKVTWFSGPVLNESGPSSVNFRLPDASTVARIKEYAGRADVSVMAPGTGS